MAMPGHRDRCSDVMCPPCGAVSPALWPKKRRTGKLLVIHFPGGRSRSLACKSCHARVVSVRPSFPTSLSARNLARAASSCRGCLRRFGLLAVIHRRRKLPLETISGVLCGGGATCRRRRNTASSPRNVSAGLEPPDQTGSAKSSCRWRRFGLKPQPDQRRTHVALWSEHERAGHWMWRMLTTTCGAGACGSDLHLIIVAAKIVIA